MDDVLDISLTLIRKIREGRRTGMNDYEKTKKELIAELHELRFRVEGLQAIEESNQMAEELREQKAFFKQIVDINPNYIFAKDREGRFTLVNKAVADVYGTTVENLIGKTDSDFNSNIEQLEHFRKDDLEVMDTLKDKIIPEECITDVNGNLHWLQTVKRAIVGDKSRCTQILGVSTDITERKLMEEELRKTHNELEERVNERTIELEKANRAKSEFLANMSHELRTPLHGILSFANFGISKLDTVSRERLMGYFQQIKESGKVLLSLLNDLLDLAKLESGKMDFTFRVTNLKELADKVVDEFSSLVSERNISIKYNQPRQNVQVTMDAKRTMQVIRNLLSNALKFSPENGVIEINVYQGSDFVKFSVQDQGKGIPKNELETVFDKFIQSSKSKTGAGGTGLGLSICQEIISAHKGRIWAENSQEGGAILLFEIPTNLEPTFLSSSAVIDDSLL